MLKFLYKFIKYCCIPLSIAAYLDKEYIMFLILIFLTVLFEKLEEMEK